jgi:hypothetical protein
MVPVPRRPVAVRVATPADLSFIDALQKAHAKMVGWMPTKQLEGKIGRGQVIVAEDEAKRPVGYCIGHDQYFKRDDVGIIYQMNVVPDKQRGLIGATLVKAMFDRAAYGCRLFCCWCAQDIEANYFWESLGFIALAFRAGSRGKGRVHIFWQRRIRAGDTTTTYWFPSQTTSGSIREDRLVFPIPPGLYWHDPMPIVLPGAEPPKLESPSPKPGRRPKPKVAMAKPPVSTLGRLWFAPPVDPKPAKPRREAKPKVKNDPKLVAAARELRDRWLEHVGAHPEAILSQGKYDVTRQLKGQATELELPPLLEAA